MYIVLLSQKKKMSEMPELNINKFFFIASPLDQFEIRSFLSVEAPLLGNLHIFLSNIAFYLTIAAFLSYLVNLLARNYNIVANTWSISPPKPHSFTSLPLQAFSGTNILLLPTGGHSNGGNRTVIKMKTITELQDEFGKKNYNPWHSGRAIKEGHRDDWTRICRALQKSVDKHEEEAENFTRGEDEDDAEKVKYHYNKMLEEYAKINELQRERNAIPRTRTPVWEGDCAPECTNPHFSTSAPECANTSTSTSTSTSTGPAKKGFDAASMLDEFDPINHVVYPAVFTYLSGLFSGFIFYLFSFLNIFISLFVLCAIPFLCYGIYVFLYNKKNKKKIIK